MPTPNYGYEKRQRELAKKQKKEEKLRAKTQRKHDTPESEIDNPENPSEPSTGEPTGESNHNG